MPPSKLQTKKLQYRLLNNFTTKAGSSKFVDMSTFAPLKLILKIKLEDQICEACQHGRSKLRPAIVKV